MSSPNSPPLSIDVRSRRLEALIANFSLACALLAPCLAFQSNLALGCASGIAAYCGVRWGFQRAGWRSCGRRLIRIGCSADGRWLLNDAAGRSIAAELRPESRIGRRFVWLRWDADNVRSMLLAGDDIPACDLRRLTVRLRTTAPADQSAQASKTTTL